MPIYEYICKKCSESFSLLQRVGVTEKDTECPKCGSKDVKKSLSTFSCYFSADGKLPSGGSVSGISGSG